MSTYAPCTNGKCGRVGCGTCNERRRAQRRARVAEPRWYQLDGTWHSSVAARLSALHLQHGTNGAALCGGGKLLYTEDGGYSEKEAIASGRTLCKRCRKLAGSVVGGDANG